jgi:hypothetical protein
MRKRKSAVLITALVAALSVAAIAYAAQVNTYTVTASTSPNKAGSLKKPVAEAVQFGYTVGEQSGQRPAVVAGYSILLKGLRTNGRYFKKCTAVKINGAGSDAVCPKGSKIGTGSVDNAAGATANPNDKSIPCHLDLALYNAGQGKLSLFLSGGPSAAKPCAVKLSAAIAGKFVKRNGGEALEFTVPQGLRHPITGVDNAVVATSAVIPRKVVTVKGKKHGFYESVGGCVKGKRAVIVTFTPESGPAATATTSAACKK